MIKPLLLLVGLLGWVQPALDATYTRVGSFYVDYPAHWSVALESADGTVTLAGDDLQLTLYSPEVLEQYQLDAYNPETLARLLVALNQVIPGTLQSTDLGGRTAALLPYEKAPNSGLLIARSFEDGAVGLMDAFGPPAALAASHDLLLHIAASFDRPPVPAPALLQNHRAPWPDLIDEFEAAGLVASGGALAFAQPYAFAAGRDLTLPLAQSLDLGSFVMAGTLVLIPGSDPSGDSCGMITHLTARMTALEVGLNSSGDLYLLTDDSPLVLASEIEPGAETRIVLFALGKRLLLYLEGALLADREITSSSGHFGLRVHGQPDTRCEISDLWVYIVPESVSGGCEIIADAGAVNQRSGPGTRFEVAGVLEPDARVTALARSSGPDNLYWWQLDDGSWVREDIVREQGACAALPLVN